MNGMITFYSNGLKIKILGLALLHRKILITVWLQQAFMFYKILCWPGFGLKTGQLLAFSEFTLVHLIFDFYFLYLAQNDKSERATGKMASNRHSSLLLNTPPPSGN